MGDKTVEMWFQMSPHLLWSNTLIEENQSMGETRSAEPCCLCNPFLDLLEVTLQNFGSEISREILCECGIIISVALRQRCWVSIAKIVSKILLGYLKITHRM